MSQTAVVVGDVFEALADPTRRQLLEHLGETGQASASALARALRPRLAISRQAIAKHLGQLESAGLVSRKRRGREIEFSVEPLQLAATGRWLQRVAERWRADLT